MPAPGSRAQEGSGGRQPAAPIFLASASVILLVVFHGNYGYFRDELYYIACSKRLAFGYVDQPPLAAAILAGVRFLFGESLHAIRLLPALACGAVVYLAARIARRLGGGGPAQTMASLAVLAAPVLIGGGKFFTMNPFDVLFWTADILIVLVILDGGRPRLWLLFGGMTGLGLLNKYSIGFLCIGLVAGLLATPRRRVLLSGWFWLGALAAALIFLPHVLWEARNGFPTIEFMRNASGEKNVALGPWDFFLGQVRDLNYVNAPIWLLGLWALLAWRQMERFRALGWTYIVVFAVMAATNAKVYYLSPIYPLLLAAGSVWIAQALSTRAARIVTPVWAGVLALGAVIVLPFAVPVLPVETFIAYEKALGLAPRAEEHLAVADLPQYYADQFGWEEMTATVADVYRKLSPDDRRKCVIFARNYGEAGAIEFFGKSYGLPQPVCPHNNYWIWGPGRLPGEVAIIFGGSGSLEEDLRDLRGYFDDVQLAALTSNRYCMPFENKRRIFLCTGPHKKMQEIWPGIRFFI